MVLRRAVVSLLLWAVGISVSADEVTLRNGDRVSGVIVSKVGEKLLIRTPYAGEMAIDWQAIVSIATETPMELTLRNSNQPIVGTFQALPDGQARLVDPRGQSTTITLRDVDGLSIRRDESSPVRSSGRVALSAIFTRGSGNSDRIYGDGQYTARAKSYRYSISGKIDRREAQDLSTTGWQTAGDYDRFLDDVQFVYVHGWLEHNEVRNIDRLALVGAGYGLQLLDTPRQDISVRAGLDYVTLDRIAGPGTNFPGLGWMVKAKYVPERMRVEFFHDHLGIWSLENRDNVFVRSKTGLRTPLIDRLHAVAQLNVNWDRRATGRSSTDTLLLFGIDYSWR